MNDALLAFTIPVLALFVIAGLHELAIWLHRQWRHWRENQ